MIFYDFSIFCDFKRNSKIGLEPILRVIISQKLA